MIQSVKISFFLGLILLLNSCFGPIKEIKYQIEDSWNNTESDEFNPTPLKNIDNLVNFDVISSGSFDGNSKKFFHLVINGKNLIYPSYNGDISAIDILTKKEIWKYKHNIEITSGLSASNEKIFFVDILGYLIGLNSSGNLDWKSFVGEVFSTPLAFDNTVIVKTNDNNIIALNIIDGSILWNYRVPNSPLPTRSWGGLVYSDNVIYVGISSGKMIAINSQNGSLVWETTYSSPQGSSEIERSNDTTSAPVFDDFAVYVVSSKGNIASISKTDGNIIWSRPLSSFKGMIDFQDYLIVTHNSGSIYSISKESNKVRWRNSDLAGRDVSKGFILESYILFSDYQGFIHLIDSENGKIIARINLDNEQLLYPLKIYSDKLVIASTSGNFYFVNINDEKYNPNSSAANIYENNETDLSKNENNRDLETNSDDESIIDSLFFWD